jgi:HEAT repeat protein/energy-coupling factor transporter ATP-binding protein EcfA2
VKREKRKAGLKMKARDYDIDRFLEDIEEDFKYMGFFHSQQKIILEKQYIPISVTLGRKYRHAGSPETSRGHAESLAWELKSAYAIKRLADASSRVERHVPWKEAKEQHQRIMVLADPGMGKSTLLKMEARLTAQEERQKLSRNEKTVEDVIFPIVLRLSDLDAGEQEILQAVPTFISRNYPRTSEGIIHLLKEKLSEGKCFLLLDALDQVPKDRRNNLSERLNRFARDCPCPVVCTSRIVGYAGAFLDGAEEVEIVPFSREQTEQYVQNWFTNAVSSINNNSVSGPRVRGDEFLRELRDNPQIQRLAQTPLLLSLLCSLYQEGEFTFAPTRRCQIYGKIVEYMLSKWSQNRDTQVRKALFLSEAKGWIAAKIRLLEGLAYHFTCDGKQIFPPDELYDRVEKYLRGEEVPIEFRNSTTSELIRELSEEDGIIQLEKNSQRYMFLHWTFQEYLTASYLNRAKNGIDLAREHFWEYDWHETLSLLAGLMKDPIPLLRAITDEKDDIFSSLLLLAGRCIAECEEYSHPLIAEIIDRIYGLWRNYPSVDFIEPVVWTLGQTNSQMSEGLRKALNDDYSEVRAAAAKALAEIGGQQVVEPLVQALKDEDGGVRWEAAEALTEIGSQQAIEPLIQTLSDEDRTARYHAAWALGRIGSQRSPDFSRDSEVVEPLVQTLNDEDSTVRYYAAWALGEIGSQRAIEPLIQALRSEDSDVRGAAARALSKIGGQQAVSPLIRALNDQDSDVRWVAAEVLGEIGSQQAIESLIQALNDEDSDTREAAAEALGKIGSQQAIEPLIQALSDDDSDVREATVEALGKIGSQRAIEPLIQTLKAEDSDIRGAAAEALGKIGGRQAIESLIQTLSDQEILVRWTAAEALGKIGGQRAVEYLIQTLNDQDNDVRGAAAAALEKIGSQQAVEALAQAYNNDNWFGFVRETSAEALGKMGSQRAGEPLMKVFRDEHRAFRRYAAAALEKMGNQRAIEALIQAFDNEDWSVRERSAEALGKIGGQQAADALIQVLNDGERIVRAAAAAALKSIGTLVTLEKILQSPVIDIYDSYIFSTARTLAVRFSREKAPFIPVYPELITTR